MGEKHKWYGHRSHKAEAVGSSPTSPTKYMISRVCKFCAKEFLGPRANHSVSYHETFCPKNKDRKYKKGGNQFTFAVKLGLPKPVISAETRAKISKSSRLQKWTEEQKHQHSERMKLAVICNPESYSSSNRGRTKQIIVDNIKLQGQWEVDFYLWAKGKNYDISRPTTGFHYTFEGKTKTYFPDFRIESLNLYIEVKGYETERDRAKWSQFPENLCIIKAKEINEIREDTFPDLAYYALELRKNCP